MIYSSCGPIAHNEIWGKSDTNRIDEYLLEFILSDKLEVYNVENMTRFVTSIRQEVLDITQGNILMNGLSVIGGCRRNRMIRFIIEVNSEVERIVRSHGRTD